MRNMIFVLLCLIGCAEDSKKKPESLQLTGKSCEKAGEYCYTPKEGFGFDINSCTSDSGKLVMVCALDFVKECDTESMTIKLYGEKYEDVSCENVGLPIQDS